MPEPLCFQTLNISLKKEIAIVCVNPKNYFWLDSKKTSNTKVRRSLISTSDKSLSLEDVRSEIIKQFNKLKPASPCQLLEKVCVPGPPGKKGNKGSRGRRGGQGAKGKKGVQGIMGLPGRHGKQGIMGNQGMKGEKGEKGKSLLKGNHESRCMQFRELVIHFSSVLGAHPQELATSILSLCHGI